MVDVAFQPTSVAEPRPARKRSSLRTALKRKSTAAFLMTLPLILLVGILVIYPAFYSLHLATLNKSMQRFVGFGNFEFLFKRDTFWLVVKQSCIFAISAVFFKALIGFIVAHFVHNVPAKGQRKWRGMLLVPWVIPPAMSTLALALAVRSVLQRLQLHAVVLRHRSDLLARRGQLGALLGHPGQCLVRRAVLHDHVSGIAEIGAGTAL